MIIWLRTPKTGGESIEGALWYHTVLNGELHRWIHSPPKDFQFPKDKKILCLTTRYKESLRNFISWHREIWDNSTRFAVVRNPYDKCISGWKYLYAIRHKPLVEVLNNPPLWPGKPGKNEQGDPEHDWQHFTKTQTDMLTIDGRLLPTHLLRFETLNQDFQRLMNSIGVYQHLPHYHKTIHKTRPYQTYYNDETKKLVQERFKEDFVTFNYPMEL